MRLVYQQSRRAVKIGDRIELNNGPVTVDYFVKPHKPASEGRVSVKTEQGGLCEYYVSIIGARWIEREDQRENA